MAELEAVIELTAAQRVRNAIEDDSELQYLRHITIQRDRLEAAREFALNEAARFSQLASDLENEALEAEKACGRADERLKRHVKPDGSLKGHCVKLRRFRWKTPALKRGEVIKHEKDTHELRKLLKQNEAGYAKEAQSIWARKASDGLAKVEATDRQIAAEVQAYGDKATLETAETLLNPRIHDELAKVDVQTIYADFANNVLTGLEAKRAFELKGEKDMAATVEQRMGVAGEQADDIEL